MNNLIDKIVNELVLISSGIKAILLKGSHQDELITDFWSDIDILIVMKPNESINENILIEVTNNLGSIIGKEVYRSSDSITFRIGINIEESVQLLDLTICTYDEWTLSEHKNYYKSTIIYGKIDSNKEITETKRNYGFEYNDGHIESIWFKYFICIKKFARNDNLIGMHLLMDLIKEYLVIEMIERDIKYNTHIHRYGYNEHLPDKLKLSLLDYKDKKSALNYIKALAYEYDKKLVKNFNKYKSKYRIVEQYLEESKKQLRIG